MLLKRILALVCAATVCSTAARGDVFLLADDGLIQGELVNKNETPREKYVIQTVQGGRVTLDKEQVIEVRRESAAQAEYEKIRGQYADTVEDQWKLAEWCREQALLPSREVHLKRVIELDPDHEGARRGLGYMRRQGQWIRQEDIMTARGYVRYKGDWMLPQEVELLEAGRKSELAEKEWFANLKRWREWLGSDKADMALENIQKIKDPYAIAALREQLKSERRLSVRKLWVECLGRINTTAAWQVLIDLSLHDREEELRLTALDELVRIKDPEMVNLYVKALKNKDIAVINRAAAGLAAMGDASAIGPLIDVLQVHQRITVKEGSNAIATRFPTSGGGGGGLSMGSTTKVYERRVLNETVRDALVKLSGVNFGFDPEQWKAWHAVKRHQQSVSLRRDD